MSLTEFNRKTGERLDYLQLGQDIEVIRDEFETGDYRVEIIGFAKMISDIASEAYNVVIFFALAFLLTVLLFIGILDLGHLLFFHLFAH